MMLFKFSLLAYAGLVSANPIVWQRAGTPASLDEAAVAEAQRRDDTATRAFSNVQILTSDGKCLFVDKLSGDFRENLTPIQVGACGSTEGQGWDAITAGKHIDVANSTLLVSTTTNACFNFDERRAAGNQVLLFSCGGRADGGGAVTNSQIFAFNGGSGPLSFQPSSVKGKCLAVKGNVLDVAECSNGDATQSFTFGGTASSASSVESKSSATTKAATATTASPASVTAAPNSSNSTVSSSDTNAKASPTVPVPVSLVGGALNPTATAASQERDDTATRAFSSVSLLAPNGRCLSVDPTAGDYRQNLIPVALVECGGTPNEKWDVITTGKHNNAPAGTSALVVSSLMQGCINYDGRRTAGDRVTMFSCGGRADGEGGVTGGQLFPFAGGESFVMAPVSEANKTCLIPGAGRLDSGACPEGNGGLFTISP